MQHKQAIVEFTGEYSAGGVVTTASVAVNVQALIDAGIEVEHLLLPVLKHYAARQLASGIRTALEKGKPVPTFDQAKFIAWLKSERAADGAPTADDKEQGKKIAKVFAGSLVASEERAKFDKLMASFMSAKAGFKPEVYESDRAYNDEEYWATFARRFRLYKPSVDAMLAGL